MRLLPDSTTLVAAVPSDLGDLVFRLAVFVGLFDWLSYRCFCFGLQLSGLWFLFMVLWDDTLLGGGWRLGPSLGGTKSDIFEHEHVTFSYNPIPFAAPHGYILASFIQISELIPFARTYILVCHEMAKQRQVEPLSIFIVPS